jgi:transcriptional regulator with AAA-type ATPase domain
MMNLEAIRFDETSIKGIPSPIRAELSPESCQSQREKLKRAAAYVIRNQDLDRLGEKGVAEIFERRNKSRAELSRVLLHRKRIPFARTDYSVRGRLLRSLRDLLDRATKLSERNVYIIGVEDSLFDDLWAYAGKIAGQCETAAADGTGEIESWQIISHRLRHEHIPPELRVTYVGHSARAEFVRQLIVRAAASDSNVLILGETGTGKEIIARWIHYHGERQSGHFEAVNCAGIPDYLLESELFGHERGAFTGALKDKIGKWALADGGTLFLDEVGDLSPDHQAKILRVLEDGKIIRVGGGKPVSVNARVIAATNRNLQAMVRLGTFRQDLLYRLRTFLIPAPALHEHPEDIPPIANHLWRKITEDPKVTLPEPVVTELQTRRWPGNAREIKSVLTCVHDLVGLEGMDRQVLCAVLDQQNGD